MKFLGPVSTLEDRLVRPHDLMLTSEPGHGAVEAMVTRVVYLGFEVRVELELAHSGAVSVQLTKAEADELEVRAGDIVHVRATSAPAFSA
jgi:sulfate transport system ATP-binding protein